MTFYKCIWICHIWPNIARFRLWTPAAQILLKDVTEITIDEAAILVGILPAPASFRPDKFPHLAQEKRDRVLQRMAQAGWNVQDALDSPIPIYAVSPLGKFKHAAFAQASISWLEDNFEKRQLYTTGLNVFTSLDIVAQKEGGYSIKCRHCKL